MYSNKIKNRHLEFNTMRFEPNLFNNLLKETTMNYNHNQMMSESTLMYLNDIVGIQTGTHETYFRIQFTETFKWSKYFMNH